MKRQLFTLLFTFFGFSVSAQLDYRKMRDTICPPMTYCGVRDSTSLSAIYPKLLAVDTTLISEGIAEYYDDLARTLTDLSIYHESDTSYSHLALSTMQKYLYHKPDDFGMIWNAGCECISISDCDKAHYYLSWYNEVTPRRYWQKDQIAAFLTFCPSEELSKRFKIKTKTPR